MFSFEGVFAQLFKKLEIVAIDLLFIPIPVFGL